MSYSLLYEVIGIYNALAGEPMNGRGKQMSNSPFKAGKAYEKTRKEYDKRAEAIQYKRNEFEARIKETDTKIKALEEKKLAARSNFQFEELRALEQTEHALRSDRTALESILSASIKIVTPEEAKAMRGEIEAEYKALIHDYDKKFVAILAELENLREDFGNIQRIYNTLDNDLQFGSTGKYDNSLTLDKVFSPYWSLNTNQNVIRVKNAAESAAQLMNYKP